MKKPSLTPSFIALVLILMGFAASVSLLSAQQAIGFLERFALAEKRNEVLKDLIPGTEDYYYFHALHFQNERETDELKRILTEWEQRFQNSTGRKMIENREALLRYSKNPEETLAYLKRELGLNLNHRQEGKQREERHPSELDPKEVSWETFLADALRTKQPVAQFEQGALFRYLEGNPELEVARRRDFLAALALPDLPGLVDLVLADLESKASQGFGEFAIHRALTKGQLEKLMAARPELKNDRKFVEDYLLRLLPGPDDDLQNSPEVREAYLKRAIDFVDSLSAPFNSLKVHLRFQQLRHDRALGQEDERRFLAYLALPRGVSYINPEWRKEDPAAWRHPADPGKDFSQLTTFRPVAPEETQLVKDYLLKFLKDDPDPSKFAPYLEKSWLQAVFAEAEITQGIGNPSDWAALLSPSQFQALKDRVDIEFDPTSPKTFSVDDPVTLPVQVKNVPKLVVKIFEVNTLNYYRSKQEEVSTDIDLDGLVANEREVYEYEVPPQLRVRRDLEITAIPKRRGLWVVELIGGGKSSRAIIRKGSLDVLGKTTARGRLVTVLDEARRGLAGASVWVAGRQYQGDQNGQVLLPFSNDPGPRPAVLQDEEGFASLVRIALPGENYALSSGIFLEQEALRSRGMARLLMRPHLTLAGEAVSLGRLEKASLELYSVDLDGTPARTVVEDLKLRGDREWMHEFRVPERVHRITATLRATVGVASQGGKMVELSSQRTFEVNGTRQTAQVGDFYLSEIGGVYRVAFRGRNGEALAGRNLTASLRHGQFTNRRSVILKSDEQGVITLGRLDGIQDLRVDSADGWSRNWILRSDRCDHPSRVTLKAGGELRLPFVSSLDREKVAFFSTAARGFQSDEFSRLRVSEGFLLATLPAGDYQLHLKESGQLVEVKVADGEVAHGEVFNEVRRLELPVRTASQLRGIARKDGKLEISVAGGDPLSRVHVMATRFVPGFDPFEALGGLQRGVPKIGGFGVLPSLYVSGRKLGDELRYILERRDAAKYPGNMLERPEILLNPRALRETEAGREVLKKGEAFDRKETGAGSASGGIPMAMKGEARRRGADGNSPSYEFLADPPVLLPNLIPDGKGRIMVDLDALGDRQQVHVLLVDPDGTSYRSLSLDDRGTALRDLRLLGQALDPKRHFTEQEKVSQLEKGETLTIPDLSSARFEVYDHLGSVYRYFQTLNDSEALRDFSFVTQWTALSDDEKRAKYSEFASHELSFFLSRKDPVFFERVVKPYLANKRDRTFLDHYLLGEKLDRYFNPYQYARLNVVERILLAEKDPERLAALRLDLENRLALRKEDRNQTRKWFAAAVGGGAFGDTYAGAVLDSVIPASAGEPQSNRLQIRPDAEAELPLPEIASLREAKTAATRSAGNEKSRRRFAARAPADPFAAEGGDFTPATPLYRALKPTREWAENYYHQLDLEQQTYELVEVDRFWLDLARHGTGAGFGSGHLGEASGNLTEMMFALSFLDLPFESPEHEDEVAGGSLKFTAGGRALLFHRGVRESGLAENRPRLLVNQRYFVLADPFRTEEGEKVDNFVSGEFVRGVVYGSRIVVTNPTSSSKRLELLRQIPKGALPVNGQRATQTRALELPPYATKQFVFAFYFPESGNFPIFPAHLSLNDKVVAQADPLVFKVVDEPSQIDKSSWAWLSQWAGEEAVFDFLESANLHALDLSKIAWRCRESREFFEEVLGILRMRGIYASELQGYALVHPDPQALRDLLEMQGGFLKDCGLALESELITVDPVDRRRFAHLEYRPLVNNRAHPVGGEHRILNPAVREQYRTFLEVLSQRRALDDVDHLAVSDYLFLQDRVAEALAHLEQVRADRLGTELQYDYFQAYAALYREDLGRARQLARKYDDFPVDRWRDRFALLQAQLDEITGADPEVVREGNREQEQEVAATREPSLALAVEGTKAVLDSRNLDVVTVNYYEMDLEFLFSSNPFVSSNTSRFEMIRPNRSETVRLNQKTGKTTFSLPEQFRSRNVILEVRGGGRKVSTAVYANELNVTPSETMGLLTVRHDRTNKALGRVYVKVYGDTPEGPVFFKDGYTDLRGKFDYASVSTLNLGQVRKFSILVMSEEHGATVLEARVPQR